MIDYSIFVVQSIITI